MPSFPPILGDNPHSLILGSMPSQKSLAEQQYYAHPRNAFWWIMAHIANTPVNAGYAARSSLQGAGYALWDVLLDCQRPGSLDSDIRRDSEEANDLAALIANQPGIKLIAFNGTAAKQIFMRHCKHVLQQFPHLEWVQLPSTSPAHAAMTRAEKLVRWRTALDPAAAVRCPAGCERRSRLGWPWSEPGMVISGGRG